MINFETLEYRGDANRNGRYITFHEYEPNRSGYCEWCHYPETDTLHHCWRCTQCGQQGDRNMYHPGCLNVPTTQCRWCHVGVGYNHQYACPVNQRPYHHGNPCDWHASPLGVTPTGRPGPTGATGPTGPATIQNPPGVYYSPPSATGARRGYPEAQNSVLENNLWRPPSAAEIGAKLVAAFRSLPPEAVCHANIEGLSSYLATALKEEWDPTYEPLPDDVPF